MTKTTPDAGEPTTKRPSVFEIMKMQWRALRERMATNKPNEPAGKTENEQAGAPVEAEAVPEKGDHRLRLTERGDQMSESTGAKAWARQVAPELAQKARDKKPYQIDEIARNRSREYLGAKFHARVAETAYEFGVETDEVRAVLRIVLRDILLEQAEAERNGTDEG